MRACPPSLNAQVSLYDVTAASEPISAETRQILVGVAKRYYLAECVFSKEIFLARGHYYIMSVKWLRRWKVFVGYTSASSAAPLDKYFGSGCLPRGNEDILKEIPPKHWLPQEREEYGTILKDGLAEGIDFIYITEDMMQAIQQGCPLYVVHQIKRNVITTPQKVRQVDLYFRQIVLLCVFNSYCKEIEQSKKKVLIELYLHHSYYATVDNFYDSLTKPLLTLTDKMFSVHFDPKEPYRLWALPPETNRVAFMEYLKKGTEANQSYSYKLYIKGDLLERGRTLPEYDIAEFMLCELKESDWVFYNDKVQICSVCSHCKTKTILKYLCSCKYAAYCSYECKSKEKYAHKARCPNHAESDEEGEHLTLQAYSKQGIMGLRNIGNTCYMNSGLQCLAHIPSLVNYFLSKTHLKQINKTNPLGCKGQLASAYFTFIQHLYYSQEGAYSPTLLKRAIGKFAPMFNGYNQQDASELINYLLDGLHEDLNRIHKKPYIENQPRLAHESELEYSQKCMSLHLSRNDSVVTDMLTGQYKSLVTCPNCGYQSLQFDPFIMCSLPLINPNKKYFQFTHIVDLSRLDEITVEYNSSDSSMASVFHQFNQKHNPEHTPEHTPIICYILTSFSLIIITPNEPIEKVLNMHEHYIYIRKLLPNESLDHNIKVLLRHTYAPNPKNEHNRFGLSHKLLFLPSPQVSNRQLHYILYGLYKSFYEVLNYEQYILNIQHEKQPLRILGIPAAYYEECRFCKQKKCEGCALPFNDHKAIDYLHNGKIDIQLFWRDNIEDIKGKCASSKRVDGVTNNKATSVDGVDGVDGATSNKPSSTNNVLTPSSTNPQEMTLHDCLELFSEPQILAEQNSWYCPTCKDHVRARKQMQLFRTPQILILSLKRFRRKEYQQEKIECLVRFPIEGLEMGGYVKGDQAGVYDLIGVVNHKGATNYGHYTAYCKDIHSQKWFHFDDTFVDQLTQKQQVVTSAAYILFYKRQ